MESEKKLSNKIDGSELQPGDHIYSWRKLKTYAHHGIFVGEDKVIHFTSSKADSGYSSTATVSKNVSKKKPCTKCGYDGKAGVIETCLDCFLKGGELYRYGYNISRRRLMFTRFGTCTSVSCGPVEDTLRRAYDYLKNGYITDYSFLEKNCEDFAVNCKTGLTVPTGADTNTLSGQPCFLRLMEKPYLLAAYPIVRIHEDSKLRKICPKH
ncbi:protein LEAD-SENSITIVE 1-like [Magnolia sinica]|uniref:protein LEAD-SENSITIVE 1-like n=1 Tax=Magnolia sinica TaxID=86752 RepID=UPI002658AEE3|nr:protein LEAD-SENSITIVE 1-like [Magnolia sinica]